MLDKILGFFWPPFGWYLRKCEFDAWDREQYAKWYAEIYIPWQKRESARLFEDAKKPMFFRKFIVPNLEGKGLAEGESRGARSAERT